MVLEFHKKSKHKQLRDANLRHRGIFLNSCEKALRT